MSSSSSSRSHAPISLCIHGHFYQPPRENPWSGWIDHQESAFPYSNWNERINVECYTANCFSRILDSRGRIEDVVNNFEEISFNFGATLLNWLEEYHPDVHAAIVKADERSVRARDGHGNALAQTYHHVILPLADGRDRNTELLWGVADFRRRFGRRPEGIWLPETAIDGATIEALIDHRFRFIVLAPSQAERVRSLSKRGGPGRDSWYDVSETAIDTRLAYRIFGHDGDGRRDPERILDVFFYDGEVAKAVAFEHLLKSADAYADRLLGAADLDRRAPQLVNVATDGESYGHHEAFGDMCLAALMKKKLDARRLRPTNYGAFLDQAPPSWEVELKAGPHGEGTAWSCSHGVGRWYRDCGCNAGSKPGWNQEWRKPLRQGLDHLRNELRRIFVRELGRWLKDPWEARDDYIQVVMARWSEGSKASFIQRHIKRGKKAEEARPVVFPLLESQRWAMAMYTSCGWFFDEISGLEPVQNMHYAARAIELAQPWSGIDLKEIFLCHLRFAKSNVEDHEDGAAIYEKLVPQARVSPEQAVFSLLLEAQYLGNESSHYMRMQRLESLEEDPSLDGLPIDVMDGKRRYGRVEAGTVTLVEDALDRRQRFEYLLLRGQEGLDLQGWVRPISEDPAPSETHRLAEILAEARELETVSSRIEEIYGSEAMCLCDVAHELRMAVARKRLTRVRKELGAKFMLMMAEARPLISSLQEMKLPIDGSLARLCELSLNHHLSEWVEAPGDPAELRRIFDTAEGYGVTLNRLPLKELLQADLVREVQSLRIALSEVNADGVTEIIDRIKGVLDLDTRLKIDLVRQKPENLIDALLEEEVATLAEGLEDITRDMPRYELIRQVLELAEWFNFAIAERKGLVDRFEQRLADRPELWP